LRTDSPVPRRAAAISVLALVAVGAAHLATRGGSETPAAAPAPAPSSQGTPTVSVPTVSSPSSTASPVEVTPSPSVSPSPAGAELPRGGREVFPRYRLVGYSGAPGSAAFGRLGVGRLDDRVTEIEKVARSYGVDREPLPVLELIAVVVQAKPGTDGRYRVRIGDDVIRTYLDAARRHRALLLLNVQPGRARFLDEVRALERWLREPDVGVALDPEWAVGPGQTPGRVFGSTTGAVVDGVAAYLDGLVRARRLPQKVLVVHQLNPRIVTGWEALRRRDGVAVVKSVDGIGNAAEKISTWKRLVFRLPSTLHPGFKLFFDEDRRGGGKLMSPAQVLGLRPRPEYVLYE
jgi:hypothetical protein